MSYLRADRVKARAAAEKAGDHAADEPSRPEEVAARLVGVHQTRVVAAVHHVLRLATNTHAHTHGGGG
jgi:hypothetical protein